MRFSREARMASTSDRVQLLAMCKVPDVSWNFVAREAQRRGLEALLGGSTSEDSQDAQRTVIALGAPASSEDERQASVAELIHIAERDRIHLPPLLPQDHPPTPRLIH